MDFGEPVWGLALRVQAADGRPEYDVRFVTIHPAHISRPRRGERLAVRIAADDPRKVAVEWGRRQVVVQRVTDRRGRPKR